MATGLATAILSFPPPLPCLALAGRQVYNNITNVVAKISWKEIPQEESHSILINSHYDTVSGSSGASDDAVGVACMLETIRALLNGPPLRHPIIFLFNGAEESLMQVRGHFLITRLNIRSHRALMDLLRSIVGPVTFDTSSTWKPWAQVEKKWSFNASLSGWRLSI